MSDYDHIPFVRIADGDGGTEAVYMGIVGTDDDLLEVELSLDTSAYADGDVLADTQEIEDAFRESGGKAILQSVYVIDKDYQGIALDLVFLRSNTSIGTENAAIGMSDADAEEVLTVVPISADDFVDMVTQKVAIKTSGDQGMGVLLKPTTGTSLYIGAVSRGAGTYTAAGIVVKVGLLRS